MFLMLKDTKVLYFDLDDFVVTVINNSKLPFSLRDAFRSDNSPKSILSNIQLLKTYLSRRVLSLNRTNAKQIYTMFGIPQSDDIETRVKICLACKGVSIQDSYWVKGDTENTRYDDINIRKNNFKELVDIALWGYNPTMTTNNISPELTTKGVFRKSWVRYRDGLYLLKSDMHINNINTRMEVLASNILDCFSKRVNCVTYSGRRRTTAEGKVYVSKCKNFVNEYCSFVEAWEVASYYNRLGRDYVTATGFALAFISDMIVLDYIISNTDRHTQNFGFLMDNKTGCLVGFAPLFDYNCALVSDYFDRNAEDTLSQVFNNGSTLRQLAYAYKDYSSVRLDLNKFNTLREKYIEYDKILKRVYERYRELGGV